MHNVLAMMIFMNTNKSTQKNKKPFLAAMALWVSPDFSDVMRGLSPPPRVNHSTVNFQALHQLFSDVFRHGPPHVLRVANDTIDQVVVHTRSGGVPIKPKGKGSMQCEDFGELLIKVAARHEGAIIDVRSAWAPLQHMDRDHAPPPMVIPFILETQDFEDALIWHHGSKVLLGVKQAINMHDPLDEDPSKHQGEFPSEAMRRLEQIFGCRFEPEVVLASMAYSKVPKVYRDAVKLAAQS